MCRRKHIFHFKSSTVGGDFHDYFPLWKQQLCCVNLMELLPCDAAQADEGSIKENNSAKDCRNKNHNKVI